MRFSVTGFLLPPRLLILLISGLFMLYGIPAAAQDLKKTRLSLQAQQKTLKEVFKEIETRTGLSIEYQQEILDINKPVNIRVVDQPLEKIFGLLLSGTQTRIIQQGNSILIIKENKPTAAKDTLNKKNTGIVTGKVVDEENGDAVPGATIKIGSKTVISNTDGAFTIALPKGQYTARITSAGYSEKELTDITIKDNLVFTLNIPLKRSKGQLAGVVVTASAKKESVAGLYIRQKNNVAISDGISAEQIRVTPDNNAAQVLKRISGLTVQDEKFVTVRGLSERYNNVTLNGASLPSTEPNRRNFAFDIIPGALIDNITVNKTATPDMSAEFAGGLVQINTKDIPTENYATITIGSGINTNSTGETFRSVKRGSGEAFGFAPASRTWWVKGHWDTRAFRQYEAAGNWDQVAALSRAIPNNFGLHQYAYTPVHNFQFALGRKIPLSKEKMRSLGLTLAVSSRSEQNKVTEMRFVPTDYYVTDSISSTWHFNSALGAVANLAYQSGPHKIVFKNLYNRRLSNTTNDYYGPDINIAGNTYFYNNQLLVNTLLHSRLEGEHTLTFHKIKLDWAADLIQTIRDQPDNRTARRYVLEKPQDFNYYLNDNTGFLTQGITIFNSRLKENRKNFSINGTVPFNLFKGSHKIKTGYALAKRDADYNTVALRMFSYPSNVRAGDFDEVVFGLPDYLLADTATGLIKPGYLRYKTAGPSSGVRQVEDYAGKQTIQGSYLMADLRLLKKLRLVGGVRMENNRMEINGITYDYNTGNPRDSGMHYNVTHWLPSANLTWSFHTQMNIRAAWSKTLSRADFRERSRYQYWDATERAIFFGAEGLRDAVITNADLRYEYYPGPGEVISFSLFYKKFNSPVELVASREGSNLKYYYFNLTSSDNKGVELDFRKSLGFISKTAPVWQRIFVSGNASWMKSDVRYNVHALLLASNGAGPAGASPPDSRNRPLQGLSPYAINAGIGYFGDKAGINLSYNRTGRRIAIGGLFPYEDQYENARDVLDLQVSGRFLKKKMEARLNISDLLQQAVIIYQNVSLNGPSGGRDTSYEGVTNDNIGNENVNNDPKGLNYNKDLDYVRYRGFKGRNISLNLTWNF